MNAIESIALDAVPGGFFAKWGVRLIPYAIGVGIVALLGVGVHFWNVHERNIGRAEVQAEWDAQTKHDGTIAASVNAGLVAALAPKFAALDTRLADINSRSGQIDLKMIPAINADPRYHDPKCALTGDVLQGVNEARAMGAGK